MQKNLVTMLKAQICNWIDEYYTQLIMLLCVKVLPLSNLQMKWCVFKLLNGIAEDGTPDELSSFQVLLHLNHPNSSMPIIQIIPQNLRNICSSMAMLLGINADVTGKTSEEIVCSSM